MSTSEQRRHETRPESPGGDTSASSGASSAGERTPGSALSRIERHDERHSRISDRTSARLPTGGSPPRREVADPDARTEDPSGDLRFDHERSPEGWLHLPAETASVPMARRYVRRAVRRLLPPDGSVDRTVVDALSADLELAASELVTNAVEHGRGESVELSVSSDGGAVTLEVVSDGEVERLGPSKDWQIADVGSTTGRGLGIVRALSDRVAVHRADGTVSIRLERDLPA